MPVKTLKKTKNSTKKVTKTIKTPKTPTIKAKKLQTVHAVFILDKSGSMSVRALPTISGFNEYLNTLKQDQNADYIFTLTLFDTDMQPLLTAKKLLDVPELTRRTYQPSGTTALYDAVGTTIRRIDDAALTTKADKILVVILTDGQENSSREFTRTTIFQLIKQKEALGNWSFVYLGCDQDSYGTGLNLGIAPSNNLHYDSNLMGSTFRYTAAATSAYSASAAPATRNFSDLADSKAVRSYNKDKKDNS